MTKYSILNQVHVDVHVTNNPYQFNESQLFEMAMRINKKRSFLFISNVLGKHIALPPQIPLLLGQLLAMRYMDIVHQKADVRAQAVAETIKTRDNLHDSLLALEQQPVIAPQPMKVIGFAETATALGHAFFNAFAGDIEYVHTTREHLINLTPLTTFEEEHSHATTHNVYMQNSAFFDGDAEIALVDDELTTGQTNLNIIAQILARFPHKKRFVIVSILDWRSDEHRQAYRDFEAAHGITIQEVNVLEGRITVHGEAPEERITQRAQQALTPNITIETIHMDDAYYMTEPSKQDDETICYTPYFIGSGRFGLSKDDDVTIRTKLAAKQQTFQQMRRGNKTLVLGTGEFMYIPMRIAALLGDGVMYHSTTRSPIYAHPDSYIYNQYTFESPEHAGVQNYAYNIPVNHYDDAFIILERVTSEHALQQLIDALSYANIPQITIIKLAD
ncbi:MAG: phosphoribosyltransferase family protein [Caryophanon sp.]|nr:phosphoribosyltransferase family protein [Caryophanon sp.]